MGLVLSLVEYLNPLKLTDLLYHDTDYLHLWLFTACWSYAV